MGPRITDIAKAAEVSPAAVSLALNNRNGISKELRQKIFTIAVKMGYKNLQSRPYPVNENITIRLVKIAKHGHIVNERHNAFITEYLEGIELGAKKRRYKLEVSFYNKVSIQEIIEAQQNSAADGLIVLGTELNAHELTFFTALPHPIVFIDTYFPLSVYDCIDMDNADGVFKAVQHFYNSGHRGIGLVKSSYDTRNFKMRELGFREAMEYFSLPVREDFIIPVDPAFDQSVLDMSKRLQQNHPLPSAFFCMNDIIAYGCLRALRSHGVRVPGDISVIGFDDLPSSSLSEPPLSTIKVSTRQIGERALEKLSERIFKQEDHHPENILIAGTLILRESTKNI
jgi:LacI family transcriptional regulator